MMMEYWFAFGCLVGSNAVLTWVVIHQQRSLKEVLGLCEKWRELYAGVCPLHKAVMTTITEAEEKVKPTIN